MIKMKDEYIRIWNKIAPKFSKSRLKITHPDNEKMLLKELKKDSSVLDVGCANGKYVFFLVKKGFKAVGIDLSEKMIQIAKKELIKNKSSAKFFVMNAAKLEFPDKSFDYTISTGNSLGMIPNPEQRVKALKEMIRVSREKIILELLKSDITKETRDKYYFSGEDEYYIAKRWTEEEIQSTLKLLYCNKGIF